MLIRDYFQHFVTEIWYSHAVAVSCHRIDLASELSSESIRTYFDAMVNDFKQASVDRFWEIEADMTRP